MFIEVEKDIVVDAVKNSTNSRLNLSAEVLMQLAMAVQRHAHVVLIRSIIDPKYKRYFDQLEGLIGKRNVDLFRSIVEQRPLWGALDAQLEVKALITLSPRHKTTSNLIVVNPNVLSNFHFEQETFLLTENILDAMFFRHLVLYYKRQANLSRADYCFYPIHGGGATIGKVFEYEISNSLHFCIAITDSDKVCSEDDMKGTYSKAKEVYDKNNQYSTCTLYGMQKVSEIENLVPKNILEKHTPTNLKQIKWQSKDLSYYDIKVGLKAKKLFGDSKIVSYWESVFPEINFDDVKSELAKYKTRTDFNEAIDKAQKNELVPLCWGSDIIERVEKANYSLLNNIAPSDLSKNQQDEWQMIGKHIFAWSCSLKAKL